MRKDIFDLYLSPRWAHVVGEISCLVLVVVAMIAPALWNGYPTIYFDSEDYVNMSFTGEVIVWRTMPYATFLTVARPFGTLFAVVIVQSLIVTWFLHEFIAAFIWRRQKGIFVGLSIILSILTGLPWVTSQILADVFAGLPALGLAVLAFGERLPMRRRAWLVPAIAIAVATHMSHVAVASGLLLCLIVLRACAQRWKSVPRPSLVLATSAVIGGVILVPVIHKIATGEAFFSRAGRVLQLALLVQDGLAQRYLKRVCPDQPRLVLCPYVDQLPDSADAFLWAGWASPIDEIGGWSALKVDADVIVSNVVAMFPFEVVKAATLNTLRQLTMVSVGEGLERMSKEFHFSAVYKWYPKDISPFETARQQQGGLDLAMLNAFQRPVALFAQAVLPLFCFIAWRRRDLNGAGMALIVLLALVGNAFVCGALSNPHDRYQNRIVWIAVLSALILPLRWYQSKYARESDLYGGKI